MNEKNKSEARDALALALKLNEPEPVIEGLKRLCIKKALDGRVASSERARFRSWANALIDVQKAVG